MPELPEVETVRRGLEQHVTGRTIATVQVLHPRAVRRDAGGFTALLPGRQIVSASRRGKYLWLSLDDGPGALASPAEHALLAHLGMSGQFLIGDQDRPLSPHVRVWLRFTDSGPDLRFTDQRTFGHLAVVPFAVPASPAVSALAVAPVPASIVHIAPDPLEQAFDPAIFAERLTRKRTGIKRALLDQSLISGVGNIYADEALWRARLHWARATNTLTPAEITRLVDAVREVLREALVAGGTSFDSLYVNVNGESGYFGRALAAYGQTDQPCPRCGTPIRRDHFMNRSSFSCPHCQPRPKGSKLHM